MGNKQSTKQIVLKENVNVRQRRYYGHDETIIYLLSLDRNMTEKIAYQMMRDARFALLSNSCKMNLNGTENSMFDYEDDNDLLL